NSLDRRDKSLCRQVAREAGFDNVWIQPAAGDDGIAIGCAYYGWLEILKQRRSFVMDHSYVGKRVVSRSQRARASSTFSVSSWVRQARPSQCFIDEPPIRHAVERNAAGHAEVFRADRAGRAHEGDLRRRGGLAFHADRQASAPRMARADSGDRACRRHRAGADRVREETNPMLYRLLKEFEALTGVPVLINTSFNIKGEPIVETPQDAVNCFLTTGIDRLV